MSGFLVDTNVVSEFTKPEPARAVLAWFRLADPRSLFASAITIGEIRIGIEAMPVGKRRQALEHWLETDVPAWFGPNVLPITPAIADRWGRLTIHAKRQGGRLATADGLIGATAAVHGLSLVTRNTKDFGNLGISLVDPWTAQVP